MATSRVSKPWNVRPGVRLGHKDEQPGKKEVGVVGTPLFTVRSNAFYDRCAAQPTRLAMAIERAKRLVRTVGIQRPESTAQTAYRSGMHRNKPGPRA